MIRMSICYYWCPLKGVQGRDLLSARLVVAHLNPGLIHILACVKSLLAMLSEWPLINLLSRIPPIFGFWITKRNTPYLCNASLCVGHGNAISLRLQSSLARHSSSSSSRRWQTRHGKDKFAREARVQGLKSRAAFKLLEVGRTTLVS